MTISRPHRSVSTGWVSKAVMASTTIKTWGNLAPIRWAIVSRSWEVAVEVSHPWRRTARIPGLCSSAAQISSAEAASPYFFSREVQGTPWLWQMSTQRWPNFPVTTARAGSSGDSRLDTAASIAPVPEDVKMTISFSVLKIFCRFRRVSRNSSVNWAVR